jgi:myo-inositol catabolism protein IolC
MNEKIREIYGDVCIAWLNAKLQEDEVVAELLDATKKKMEVWFEVE